jgi:hypothetical protein
MRCSLLRASSKTRTHRFDPDLIVKISKVAKLQGLSENEYVNRSMYRAVIMDLLLRNIDGIGVSLLLFSDLIAQANLNTLEVHASELVSKNFLIALTSLGYENNSSSVIRFMQEVLQILGWFRMERVNSENLIDFHLYHKVNQKWSAFLKSLFMSIFDQVHEKPEITISDKMVRLRFSKESSSWRTNERSGLLSA